MFFAIKRQWHFCHCLILSTNKTVHFCQVCMYCRFADTETLGALSDGRIVIEHEISDLQHPLFNICLQNNSPASILFVDVYALFTAVMNTKDFLYEKGYGLICTYTYAQKTAAPTGRLYAKETASFRKIIVPKVSAANFCSLHRLRKFPGLFSSAIIFCE